jgi:hypothetical protein
MLEEGTIMNPFLIWRLHMEYVLAVLNVACCTAQVLDIGNAILFAQSARYQRMNRPE